MRKNEVDKMDKAEVGYNMLLFKMNWFNEELNKVTLLRKHNKKKRLISSIVCFLLNESGNTVVEKFRLYDSDYLWFLNSIKSDFPDVDFVDLTDDENKVNLDDVH